MRFSLVLTACVGGAMMLAVTACQPAESTPIKGTVVEKEHHPADWGTEKKVCSTTPAQKGKPSKETCSKTITGTKPECYELEIRTQDGAEVDVCDKAAYSVLDIDDPYDSSQDYSREDQ